MADKKKIIFGTTAGIAAAVAAILGEVYQDEGGFSNVPQDRGGATNFGVTEKVAREAGWKGTMRAFPKQCETTTDVCADRIYYENYIEKPGYVPFIKASPAVSEELVNTAVNMGPSRPNKWLQESINDVCTPKALTVKIAVDGKLGSGTLSAFTTCQTKMGKVTFCKTMLNALDGKQKNMYDRIVRNNPSQRVFYKGWVSHRIGNVDRKKCDIEA
jgi:lysozyme family protein